MWVVTGGHGQLGRSLTDVLHRRNIEHRAVGRADLDITDSAAVSAMFDELRPSVVVNTAAWTAVDAAEDHPTEAFALNADGARNVAVGARRHGARLVQISTDYVFDGDSTLPYSEHDATNPRSIYGSSKLRGEQMVAEVLGDEALIVRTAWLYSEHGSNFVKTMTRRALADAPVRVVDDQHGQPTLAKDLAALVVDLVEARAAGIHHGTSAGDATWHRLTLEIYDLLGRDRELVSACPSSDYPMRATRPRNSVLGHQRTELAGVRAIRPWQDALHESIDGIRASVSGETA